MIWTILGAINARIQSLPYLKLKTSSGYQSKLEKKVIKILEKTYWPKKSCWQTKDNLTECTLKDISIPAGIEARSYTKLRETTKYNKKNKTEGNTKKFVSREMLMDKYGSQHYVYHRQTDVHYMHIFARATGIEISLTLLPQLRFSLQYLPISWAIVKQFWKLIQQCIQERAFFRKYLATQVSCFKNPSKNHNTKQSVSKQKFQAQIVITEKTLYFLLKY